MKGSILVISLLFSPFGFGQDTIDTNTVTEITFEDLLEWNKMEFIVPEGLIETLPLENMQMNYEKAYKHPTKRFEVRYAIRNHDTGFYKQIFEMTVLNISGGQLPEYSQFGTEAVKEEFNADAGATVMVEVGSEFGQDYKYCLFVQIYKQGLGDGYVFYMADDNELILDLMNPIFHALKFSPD